VTAALLLAAAAAFGPGPAPSYLVERVVTTGVETRRLSVFRDGVAVLAAGAGEQRRVVRLGLQSVELRSLVQLLGECLPELAALPPATPRPGEGSVELRLALPAHEPVTVRRSLAEVPSAAEARLAQALDAIETTLAARDPSWQDLRGWQPAVGDVVDLDDGKRVRVVELLAGSETPLARVLVGDGPVTIVYDIDELRRHAIRRVAP
jgi:hypothetical protein